MSKEVTGSGSSTPRPPSAASSSTTAAPVTVAPQVRSNFSVAETVPPVASTSSMIDDRASCELDAVGR